jgi:hypothetical protein
MRLVESTGKLDPVVRRLPALALVALLALLACERRPETDHLLTIRNLCAELGAEAATPDEATRRLGVPPVLTFCADALPSAGAGDRCPRDQGGVCALVWAYRARSAALCGGEACSYGCELRVLERAPTATCGVRDLTGEEEAGLP